MNKFFTLIVLFGIASTSMGLYASIPNPVVLNVTLNTKQQKSNSNVLKPLPFKIGVAIDASTNMTRIDIQYLFIKVNVVFSGTTGTFYVYVPNSPTKKCALEA